MSAPKARQTISLGREPQGNDMNKLKAAKRRQTIKGQSAADAAAAICRPSGLRVFVAPASWGLRLLGLTPQAKYLSPLRGWAVGVLGGEIGGLATGPWLISV
jgi:hypothetical protein